MGMGQGDSTADGAEAFSNAPDSEPQWPWDPASRCYLADMHDTEVTLLHALFCRHCSLKGGTRAS